MRSLQNEGTTNAKPGKNKSIATEACNESNISQRAKAFAPVQAD
jgi:hypothetical protein